MVWEDWIDMSIIESTATLDIGAVDSRVIFDHDNSNTSMGSVNTRVYMNNSTPAGVKHSNGTTTVNGFAAARKLTGPPMDQNEGTESPSGEKATTQGASAVGPSELPQSASAGVVGMNV